MTLKFIIRNVTNLEIEFFGDDNELNQIKDILSSTCLIKEGRTIDWEGDRKDYPSFAIGLCDLYLKIQDKSVSQVILKFIDDNKINISFLSRYLLQYWDYEVSMITHGKSKHKVFNPNTPYHLSSPILLDAILSECEKKNYIPGFERLFQFLEQSKQMESNYLNPYLHFCKPFKFNVKEVNKFISKKENNLFIAKESRVQGKYQLLMFDKKLVKVDTEYMPQEQNNRLI
ncbi:hypothetical protein [Legionella gresilensis]|uniref:hypothetical protein n=1 Tax=Legionella gresilensis TaxID=91823 RepID=UPI00104186DC|nr:hypothetical protein [Legionella gresilensis]